MGRTPPKRVQRTLLRRAQPIRARRIPPRRMLPARRGDFQRLQPLPFPRGESGHHRSGPLPRRGPGGRTLLLREGRCAKTALAPEHLQGDCRRPRTPRARERFAAPLGRTGCATAQRHTHRARPCRRLAPRPRLGTVYGRRHSASLSRTRQPRVHPLGSYAQKKGQVIDRSRHLVLTSAHPSPLSAYRGFFGNHHFSLCNDYLIRHGISPIVW